MLTSVLFCSVRVLTELFCVVSSKCALSSCNCKLVTCTHTQRERGGARERERGREGERVGGRNVVKEEV